MLYMKIQSLKTQFFEGNKDVIVYISESFDEISVLREYGVKSSILMISGFEWNRHLSPWPSERIFRKGDDFAGQADLLADDICEILRQINAGGKLMCAGYSLAGLFALYLCSKTKIFDACISASGSLWYPGFKDYLIDHHVNCRFVYLSLGDKEKNTKNPVMQKVQTCTEEIVSELGLYTEAVLEMNPGNHFNDPAGRIAKGMKYTEVWQTEN